jgi:hypothetical protein
VVYKGVFETQSSSGSVEASYYKAKLYYIVCTASVLN